MLAIWTSKRFGAVVLAASLVLAAGKAHAQSGQVRFTSPEAALEQGIGAYRGGFYQHALPALRFAADHGLLLGQYHLARLYADNAGAQTDHSKAYDLFNEIVVKHARAVDFYDDDNAPYVGRSLTALARYYLRGLPDHGLQPDAARAAEYLQQADTFFRDPDARFELAKMYLTGEGVPENHRQALSRLKGLKEDGHVAATAFVADLLWRGKIVKKDEVEALRLIRWAVDNAPAQERIWIEDIYGTIYCGASAGVRQQAEGSIAGFRRAFTPRPPSEAEEQLGVGIAPKRTCDNGEVLPLAPMRDSRAPRDETGVRSAGSVPPQMPSAPAPGVVDIRGQGPAKDRR
ncbi:MAG: tetratricopeptide repeat protein [Hyphomicrobiaceae bacterium]